MRRFARILPAAIAAALLIAAARPPARAPVPDAMVYSGCSNTLQQGSSAPLVWLPPFGGGVTQVVPGLANAAACSLDIALPCYSQATIRYVQWDPTLLAPDPTTVALRTHSYYLSQLIFGSARLDFVPPVVARRLPGVAEPPGTCMAMDFAVDGLGYRGMQVFYTDSGDVGTPAALAYGTDGLRDTIPGLHAVLAHAICGGDARLQKQYVVQSVMTCSAVIDTSTYELVQRFRVPQECQLDWIELASAGGWGRNGAGPAVVGVLDGAGVPGPPATPVTPLVSAALEDTYDPRWMSHYDFDALITLEPGHDYWLWVRGGHAAGFRARQLTGAEGAAFTSGVGPLYARADADAPFGALAGEALAFRLIGVPTGMVGVGAAPRPPTPLVLRALANPAHGAVLLAWAGARGALLIDVLDVRGRRVGGGASGATAAGRWLWTATRADGAPLAAGVYFVRARDASGAEASERVVLVR